MGCNKFIPALFGMALSKEIRSIFRLSAVFLFIFVLYLTANYFIVRSLALHEVKQYLKKTAVSVSKDFIYRDGAWDTNAYLSDTTTPSEIPLYIFSLDGFLIDRRNVVAGLLDTSNFAYASSFVTPRTIVSPVGEHWRVLSYPIQRNDRGVGAILVGYFEPEGRAEKEIDALLFANAQKIDRQITVLDGVLDGTRVAGKDIDHNISFEVVDTYNRSHASIGGPPAYIDKSYLQDVLKMNNFTVISDRRTNQRYMLHIQPIMNDRKSVGIVVFGKSLEEVGKVLNTQLQLSGAAGLFSILVFMIISFYLYRHDVASIVQERIMMLSGPAVVNIDRIVFFPKDNKIVINDIHDIAIPFDSYQHDICSMLFKHPKKKFDTFDLSDAIGELDEQKNMKRLVYDAVEAINLKVKKLTGVKLITHREKKYSIDPTLTPNIF